MTPPHFCRAYYQNMNCTLFYPILLFRRSFSLSTHTLNHKRVCLLRTQRVSILYTKRVKLVGFQTDNVRTDIDTGTYKWKLLNIIQLYNFYHTIHFDIQYIRAPVLISSLLLLPPLFFPSTYLHWIHAYLHTSHTKTWAEKKKKAHGIVLHKLYFTSLQRFVCDYEVVHCWCAVLCVCKSLVMCVSRSSQCQHIECRRNKIAMCLHFQWKLNDKTSTWMSIFGQ